MRSLIREAATELRQSNDRAQAKAVERHLAAVQAIGRERYETYRCRKFEDLIKDLEAQLNLLRPKLAPQISEEQGRRIKAAMHRDLDRWAMEGGTID